MSEKKIKCYAISIIATLLITIVSSLMLITPVAAATTYYIYDDFNNGTSPGWSVTQTGGAMTTTTAKYMSPTHSLKIYNVHVAKSFTYETYEGKFAVWTADNFQFFTKDSTTDTGLDIKCLNSNIMYYNGASWVTLGACAINQWHNISFSVNNQHFNLTVDDTIYSNLTGIWTGNGITQVKFTAGTGGTYIDDFIIVDAFPVLPLSWSTDPWLNGIIGKSYSYNADCTWKNVTYTMSGNASFLSINTTSGQLSGTPISNDKGIYNVNLTATTGSRTIYQNYTLTIWSPISFTAFGYSEYSNFWVGNDGVLYNTYLDSANMVRVASFADGIWSESVLVGENPTDNQHGISSIMQSDDGYFHIFYGCHETPMQYAKSSQPNNISAWTMVNTNWAGSATYPWLFKQNDGTMINLYRVTVSSGENYKWVYRTSDDNGTTWGTAVTIIQYGSGYAPYPAWNYDPDTDRLWCAMDIYLYGQSTYKGLYILYYDFNTGHVYDVDGTDYGLIHEASEQATALEYDSPETVCIGIMTWDENGYPCVIKFDSQFSFMRWNGTAWSALENITDTGERMHIDAQLYYNETSQTFTAFIDSNGPLWRYERLANGTWECKGKFLASEQCNVSGSDWRIGNRNRDNRYFSISEYKAYEDPIQGHHILMYDAQTDRFLNADYVGFERETPEITSNPLTTSKVGISYQYQTTCNYNTLSWSVSGASFLTISSSGLVSGTPDQSGSYDIIITAQTGIGNVTQSYTLVVESSTVYAVTTNPDPTADQYRGYTYEPECNGTATVWSLDTNASWLTINPSTGIISGTPNQTGTFYVNISANTDPACWQNYTLTVEPLVWDTTVTIKVTPSGLQVGVQYTLSKPGLAWAIASVEWNLGDSNNTSVTTSVLHTYAKAGSYNITLNVTALNGEYATDYKIISVSAQTNLPSGGGGGGGGNVYDPDPDDDPIVTPQISYLWVAIIGAIIAVAAVLVKSIPGRGLVFIVGIGMILVAYYLGF